MLFHRRFAISQVPWLTLLLLTLSARGQDAGPRSPEESRRSFRLEPGVTVSCAASEPAVASPSALAFDEFGRLFVAENRGYPVGPGSGKPPVGAILELRDRDGDGRYETRVEFAAGLTFPNGLMPWRGGWLVSCAPDLIYFKDTDGDGRADLREVWFTGFATNQSTQLRACYPTLGLDGWIYMSRGWSGGIVTSPRWPGLKPVDLGRGDFRFRPDGSAAEAIGGNGQFGLAFDEFGHRFIVSNRNPLMQAVVHPREWARNPQLPFAEITEDVSPSGYDAKVFPLSVDLTTSGFMPDLMGKPHAGSYTSACGIHWYRGNALGLERQKSWFICEPAQNLVQRQVMTPNGATFRSRSATTNSDFIDSGDSWFHPVYATTGPDGALWIADMYRKFIDHPDYLPEEPRKKLDFNSGKDLGRLWRLAQSGARLDASPALRILKRGDPKQWVDLLNHRNGWVSETARRLLIQEQLRQRETGKPNDAWTSVVEARLRRLWRTDTAPSARAAALEMLKLIGVNRATIASLGFADSSGGVREVAVRSLARAPYDPVAPASSWRSSLRSLAQDPDPGVRFQVALALGDMGESADMDLMVSMGLRDAGDRWARAAVLSGVGNHAMDFAQRLIAAAQPAREEASALFRETSQMIGLRPSIADAASLLRQLAELGVGEPREDRDAALLGLAHGLRSRGWGDEQGAPLLALAQQSGDPSLPDRLDRVAGFAESRARSSSVAPASRARALLLLAEFGLPRSRAMLESLLSPSEPAAVQLAAVRSLGRFNDRSAGEILTASKRWSAYAPDVREAALSAL
ncbi:MAG: HEAT repeat domain-containing protein, partial [Verrucomicrobia bacterium]|nr:HEAT repeat domain-containing protein [Verrucomicrobiota bacterium]